MKPSMDSSPPSHRSEPHQRNKSASRLARIGDSSCDCEGDELPHLSLDLIPSSTRRRTPPSPSHHLSLKTSNPVPLQELLLLSPSPLRKSKTRVVERTEMVEEPVDLVGSRRRCKSRSSSMALLGCGSPRNGRRVRKRLEQDIREEKDLGFVEDIGKARRRKPSNRSRKEKLSLVPSNSFPSASVSPKTPETKDDDQSSLDRIGHLISDMIMWNDVAKSSLWFGFGSLCFFSSCFAREIHFSIFSVISQLGLLFLGISFFLDSFSQRDKDDNRPDFKLNEDDLVRVARVMLPAANVAIVKTRGIFSGEPSMTLKVAPLLLLGAQYGHLITLWRLCATGFFVSFTAPKLYSYYSVQINRKVDYWGCWVWDAWGACSRKKIVATSAFMAFWNLSTVKTRIFAAFISMVILRYYRQHEATKVEGEEAEAGAEGKREQEQQQALVVAEGRLQ